MLGLAIVQYRQTGKGSEKSRALLWHSLEFCLVGTFFGIAQAVIDLSGLTISTFYDIEPGGASLVALGLLTIAVGLIIGFWAIGVTYYPYRPNTLWSRIASPVKDFVLIGLGAVDAIFVFYLVKGLSSEIVLSYYIADSVCLGLGIPSLVLLLLNRIDSPDRRALAWFLSLLPAIISIGYRLAVALGAL